MTQPLSTLTHNFVLVAFGVSLAGCTGAAALNPQGPAAIHIAGLGWSMIVGGAVIWFLVIALLLLALFRHRADTSPLRLSQAQARSANAGDLIAPVVYAMRFGLTVKMMAEAMLPYPTMAEAVRWAAAQL